MDDREILTALRQADDTLAGIQVPVGMTWQIAVPVLNALAGVRACAEALERRLNTAQAEPVSEEMAIREDEI